MIINFCGFLFNVAGLISQNQSNMADPNQQVQLNMECLAILFLFFDVMLQVEYPTCEIHSSVL